MIVVLPAPFGPISPATVPTGTLNETWSTAVRSPKRFVSASTTTASVVSGPSGALVRGSATGAVVSVAAMHSTVLLRRRRVVGRAWSSAYVRC